MANTYSSHLFRRLPKRRSIFVIVFFLCVIVTFHSINKNSDYLYYLINDSEGNNRLIPAITNINSKENDNSNESNLVLSDNSGNVVIPHNKDKEKKNEVDARRESPFYWTKHVIDIVLNEKSGSKHISALLPDLVGKRPKKFELKVSKILRDWKHASRADHCRVLIDTMYRSPKWNNLLGLDYLSSDYDLDLFGLIAERIRIYNYCFIEGKLTYENVFDDYFEGTGITSANFQDKMFPFLRQSSVSDPSDNENPVKDLNIPDNLMWPTVLEYDRTEGKFVPSPVPLGVESNQNIFENLLMHSNGKGIVTTMNKGHLPMFYQQLKTLDKLENTLPIQIVSTDGDLSDEFIKTLEEFLKLTNQHVQIISVTPIMDPELVQKKVTRFKFKWLSVIFNTFEEFIFMDVDVVPFVQINEFFDIEKYKETGMYVYKDRHLPHLHVNKNCNGLFSNTEPSWQEHDLIGSSAPFDSAWSKENADVPNEELGSTEAAVYQNYFVKNQLHHVDSGLVIINKSKKLGGLLLSFFLDMNSRIGACSYGDKEVFWLGQLAAAQPYSIDPTEPGIAGIIKDNIDPKVPGKIGACGTQIAHADQNNKLIWTNGGLKTCKFDDAVAYDFDHKPDYFKDKYETREKLTKYYSSPLEMQGLIIPSIHKENIWQQQPDCKNYFYCVSTVEGSDNVELDSSVFIRFNEEQKQYYNDIAHTWNLMDN